MPATEALGNPATAGGRAMRRLAVGALVSNTVLWGTYPAVARDILTRVPQLDLAVAELLAIMPAVAVILVLARRQVTRQVLRAGIVSGAVLVMVMLTTMTALRYTTASEASFFPALNGLFAALIARTVLGTAVRRRTWGAAGLAVGGGLLLASQSTMPGERLGNALALAGAFIYTVYVFCVDRDTSHDELPPLPLFAIQLIMMVIAAALVLFVWGEPIDLAAIESRDVAGAIYLGYAATFVPTLIGILFQRYVAPVSVSFIYILEPLWGVTFAVVYLHERPAAATLLGGALLLAAAILHWSATREGGSATAPRASSGTAQTANLAG